MRERTSAFSASGAAAGAVLATVGLVVAAAVLKHGGGGAELIGRLSAIVPLIVVGLVSAVAGGLQERPSFRAIRWLWLVVALAIVGNIAIPFLLAGKADLALLVPRKYPVGLDFWDGLYKPGLAFSSVISAWPPLTLLLGRAFTVMRYYTAYQVQLVILCFMAVGSAVLSADLASHMTEDEDGSPPRKAVRMQTLWLIGIWFATSYGLMFEMERGNINAYALFFSLLCVWLTLKMPDSAWPAVIAFSIAVNLKVYPAILIVVLAWRYRWKVVLPLVVTNLVLLMAGGPKNALLFVRNLRTMVEAPYLWAGNHSAAGFAYVIKDTLGISNSALSLVLLLIPVAIWIATMIVVVRSGWSKRNAVVMAAACIPVMSTLPAVSHDYKLILATLPVAALVVVVTGRRTGGAFWWGALFAAVSLELTLLAKSTLLIQPSLLANKFPPIVLLQVLLLLAAMQWGPFASRAVTPDADESDQDGANALNSEPAGA